MVEREVYENGSAQLLIDRHANGDRTYWIQVGLASIQLKPRQILEVYELLHELVHEGA